MESLASSTYFFYEPETASPNTLLYKPVLSPPLGLSTGHSHLGVQLLASLTATTQGQAEAIPHGC